MKTLTAFTAKTPKHLLLDAGVFAKNYDVSKTYAQNVEAGNIIGATQGGGTFNAVPTIRDISVDGVRGKVKGLRHVSCWDVNMTMKLLEASEESAKLALGAAEVDDADKPTGYKSVKGKSDIEDDDYIDNVAWIGCLSGATEPVIILVHNALGTSGLALTMADNAEGITSVTCDGHYTVDDLEHPPFEILYPTVS